MLTRKVSGSAQTILITLNLASYHSGPHAFKEGELARLVLILITPDPITGARSTSASANGHTYFRELSKDALLYALDALAQSSDACSPLKSLTGGLIFFTNWADVSTPPFLKLVCLMKLSKLVSSNKEDIRDACERINNLVTYFRLAITDGDSLPPALNNTMDQLAKWVLECLLRTHMLIPDR